MTYWQRWQTLGRKEQLRWLVVSVMLMLGLYILLLYPQTSKGLNDSQNMVNRREDRIRKRAGGKAGLIENTTGVRQEFDSLTRSIKRLQEEKAQLQPRFLPADDALAEQALRLDLATLAERSGLLILNQGALRGPGRSSDDDNAAPAARKDRDSLRQLMRFNVYGSYWQLTDFLDSLKQLDYVVSPLSIEVVAQTLSGKKGSTKSDLPPGLLDIKLILSL